MARNKETQEVDKLDLPDEDRHIQALIMQADEEKRRAEEEAKYYQSRAYDNRMNSTREAEERPSFRASYIGRLNIRPAAMEKFDPDYVYGWIAEKVRNMPDEDNMDAAINLGWRPVPSSEFPEMAMSSEVADTLGRKRSNLIRKGGSLFAKILRKDFEEYQRMRKSKFETNKMLNESASQFDRVAGSGMKLSMNKSFEIQGKKRSTF